MVFYLDDCADSDALGVLLRQAGHAVHTPRTDRTLGIDDPLHLEHAVRQGYTLITRNPKDFRKLHDEWQAQGRSHNGILLIYRDNVPAKDMGPADVVHAITNLINSGLPIDNEIHSLNHWR